MQRVILILLFLLVGCVHEPMQTYVNGTSFTLGLYIPYNGSIYGLQAVSYLSGTKIVMNTNDTMKIESSHNVTNSTFGVFDLTDAYKINVGK